MVAGGSETYLAWPVENKLAIAQLVEHLTVDIADIRRSLVQFRVARLCTLVANVVQHVQVSERRRYGATAARLTPDQKVGSPNLSVLIP